MDADRARQLLERERARIEESLAALDEPLEGDERKEPGDLGSEDLYQDEFNEGRREELRNEMAALERAEARLEALPTAERTVEEDRRYRRG